MKPFTVFVVNFYEPDDLNYLTITEGVDMVAAQNAAVTLCAEAWNCSKEDLEVWLVLEGHHYDLLQTSADVSPSETLPAECKAKGIEP